MHLIKMRFKKCAFQLFLKEVAIISKFIFIARI
ncbi:hypothetical protein N483_24480 [Pseudoalteromonas luteoviolacea NCIMB 1944]|nr:hypothetical protein N483_24480 [Pseudoalteromonas luteoviolacea NCIMB 1944]